MFNQIAEESESSKRSKNVNTGDFDDDESSSDPNVFKVEVSFMEIYNEKVRDLLVANKTSLKVREHSIAGN
jgi:kinesin family protein 13